MPVWKQLFFTSCFWVECCHILFCDLVFMSVRKEKNKNILSLSSFKVDIDSDVPGSAAQAVLSSRPEQWPENERREIFLARQGRLGTLVSPQPSNSSRELSGEYIRCNSAWTRFGSVLYSRIFTRTGELLVCWNSFETLSMSLAFRGPPFSPNVSHYFGGLVWGRWVPRWPGDCSSPSEV